MTAKHVNVNSTNISRTKPGSSDYPDWRELTGSGIISQPDALELEDQIKRFSEATIAKREAEAILGNTYKPRLANELFRTMNRLGVQKLEYDGLRFSLQSGSNSRVSPELLLAHGVDPDIIQACTEVSNYAYVKMTVAGDR